jgi:putative hydrolase of the HAD superfamily
MTTGKNIAIWDGDNTLWDTNEVFTTAQKTILRRLKENGLPADPDRDFALLRAIDDLLIEFYQRREYEVHYLPLCLLSHYRGHSALVYGVKSIIASPADGIALSLARRLGSEFKEGLKRIPDLFPGVIEGLASIRATGRTLLILYSEGSEARLKATCEYHNMSAYFDDIVISDKSLANWMKVKDRAVSLFKKVFRSEESNPTLYVIGDSLERDIGPGNHVGAKTIYKPGGYKREEMPTSSEYAPTITVKSMSDVVAIL